MSNVWKESFVMNYPELFKLKQELIEKQDKTPEEQELLAELQSLSDIIDKLNFSLSMSGKVCPTCGKKL